MMAGIFARTFKSFFDPGVILILLLPFLLASALWFGILFAFWTPWTDFLISTAPLQWLMSVLSSEILVGFVKVVVYFVAAVLVFGPLWYLTYILIISLALFPLLLPRIQKKYYPGLEKKHGGSFVGSIRNTIVGTAIFLALYGLTLPLWLFTPFSPVIHLFLTAYLNKKVFTYDILQDYASPAELEHFNQSQRSNLWLLGMATAFLTWVPMANLLAPAFTSLAFVHFVLQELQFERSR